MNESRRRYHSTRANGHCIAPEEASSRAHRATLHREISFIQTYTPRKQQGTLHRATLHRGMWDLSYYPDLHAEEAARVTWDLLCISRLTRSDREAAMDYIVEQVVAKTVCIIYI